MILIYAFSNQWGTNVSNQTLLKLQQLLPSSPDITFKKIYFHPKDFFHHEINGRQYSLIIGLGDYFGPSSDKIRIETQAKNIYGHQSINPLHPINLDVNLPNIDNIESSRFKISSFAGSYNCNWILFQIQLYINRKSPLAHQLFFHLPKKHPASVLAQNIVTLLQDNKLISLT